MHGSVSPVRTLQERRRASEYARLGAECSALVWPPLRQCTLRRTDGTLLALPSVTTEPRGAPGLGPLPETSVAPAPRPSRPRKPIIVRPCSRGPKKNNPQNNGRRGTFYTARLHPNVISRRNFLLGKTAAVVVKGTGKAGGRHGGTQRGGGCLRHQSSASNIFSFVLQTVFLINYSWPAV